MSQISKRNPPATPGTGAASAHSSAAPTSPRKHRTTKASSPKSEPSAAASAISVLALDPSAKKGPTKTMQVLALLQREEGASLAELTQATGWQAHSARAFLTGLKQKGHIITRDKDEGGSRYRIGHRVGGAA